MARFRLTVETRATPSAAGRYVRRPRPTSDGYAARRAAVLAAVPAGLVRRLGLLLAIGLVGLSTWNYLQPIPAVAATSARPALSITTGTPPSLPWPSVGSAAVGASGLGLIADSGQVPPTPAASVAKVMTALVLLADKPLAKGDSGPTLILTDQDVATYRTDLAEQQSVVAVAAGEHLNEYEALEALLIPSGNNIAETLARWDAGSVTAFVAKMNQRAASLHLASTAFADPAGLSTQTVSTPTDLLAMGMAAMQQDVLAQIVNLPQTTLPVAGTVYNVNSAVGQDGIIGIKTGSGLNSGANFLFAATATVDGQQVTLYGCVMGQPTLEIAFNEARALIGTMQGALTVHQVVARDQMVGAYNTPWGAHADLVSTADVTLVEWPGMIVRQRLDALNLVIDGPVASGTPAGNLHIVLGDQQINVALATGASLDPPGFTWRLFRISLG